MFVQFNPLTEHSVVFLHLCPSVQGPQTAKDFYLHCWNLVLKVCHSGYLPSPRVCHMDSCLCFLWSIPSHPYCPLPIPKAHHSAQFLQRHLESGVRSTASVYPCQLLLRKGPGCGMGSESECPAVSGLSQSHGLIAIFTQQHTAPRGQVQIPLSEEGSPALMHEAPCTSIF